MNSLHLRLNLTAIIVLIIFLITTGAVLDYAFVENVKLSLRERMLSQLYPLINVATVSDGKLIMPLPLELPEQKLALPDSGLYAFVTYKTEDDSISLAWRSPSLAKRQLPTMPLLPVGEKFWHEIAMADGNTYASLGVGYQRMMPNGIKVFDFFLLSDLKPLTKQIDNYRLRLWGGLALAAMLLLIVQVATSRWALKPLKQVSKELNTIESGVNDGIVGTYPREIKKLTDNINSLLTQERDRQIRYRNALDNLAHSLKTPLAVLLAAVNETEDLPKVVQEQASRMLLTVERQLQKAGNASALSTTPTINLAQMVTRITTSLSKIYSLKNINVVNYVPDSLYVLCDEADLMEILGNLLDNAFKWGRHRVEIYASVTSSHLTISIHDDGLGIEPDQIAHVLQRGARADESIPGTGIGLSLVADLVEAYQGNLRIARSKLGGVAVLIELTQLGKR